MLLYQFKNRKIESSGYRKKTLKLSNQLTLIIPTHADTKDITVNKRNVDTKDNNENSKRNG